MGSRHLTEDEKWLLATWCMVQRGKIRINKRRGRRTDYTKESAIKAAYARKAATAKPDKKESIIAELAQEFGLKRRRVFEIIKDTDPNLHLRLLAKVNAWSEGRDIGGDDEMF
jgi:hypothetical protein